MLTQTLRNLTECLNFKYILTIAKPGYQLVLRFEQQKIDRTKVKTSKSLNNATGQTRLTTPRLLVSSLSFHWTPIYHRDVIINQSLPAKKRVPLRAESIQELDL